MPTTRVPLSWTAAKSLSVLAELPALELLWLELPELLGMCKRVYVVAEGRIVGELQGKDLTQETVMTYATGGK